MVDARPAARAAAAALLALAFATAAHAHDDCLRLVQPLGPTTFERGAREVGFQAPGAPAGTWFLSVSGDCAALGKLELNGREVVRPKDLAGRTRHVRVPVAVLPTNQLRVRVVGRGALQVTVQGLVPAAALPGGVGRPVASVTLASHVLRAGLPPVRHAFAVAGPGADGVFTLRARESRPRMTLTHLTWNGDTPFGPLLFTGRDGVDEAPVQVEAVNQVRALVLGPRSAFVVLSLEGWVVDEAPPAAAWTHPAPEAVVEPESLLRLAFSDARSTARVAAIALNGSDVTATFDVDDGEATATVGALPAAALQPGRNVLTARVRDGACNEVVASVAFHVGAADETPPALALVPASGAVESPDAVLLRADYADAASGVDPATFLATLDGQDVTGAFSVGPARAEATVALAPGQHTLVAEVRDRAGNRAEASTTFTVGQPRLSLSADAVDFGVLRAGTFATRTLVIANAPDATASLLVSEVALLDAAGGAFALPAPPALPRRLAAGESFAVEVTFQPSVAGTFAGRLRVASSDAASGGLVSLHGRAAVPALVVQDLLAFLDTRVGATSDATLVVSNGSELVPLTIASAEVRGATVFELLDPVPSGGLVVPPLGAVELRLRFRPLAFGTAGAELALATDDPARPAALVELSGRGTAGRLELTLEPGPASGVEAGSAQQVRARAVTDPGDLDAGFRGVVELSTTDPGSGLNGLLLLFGDVEAGEAVTPLVPAFATTGEQVVSARLLLPDEAPHLGSLTVTVLERPRGRAFLVLSSAEGAVVRPGDLITAQLLVDVGASDGDPTTFADTLGAYDVRLLFDEAVVEVLEVEGSPPLGDPLFVLRGSLRLMDMNEPGPLRAPVGPEPAVSGLVELASVTMRVRPDAPPGRSPMVLAVDALATAEARVAALGPAAPRLAETRGEVVVDSPRPPTTRLDVLGVAPRAGEAALGPLQRVEHVDVVLSRALDPATIGPGAVRLRDAGGAEVPGTTVDPRTEPGVARFVPAAPLGAGRYTAVVGTELRGAGGEALDAPVESAFTVGEPGGEPVPGDLDGDGELTILDLMMRRDRALGRAEGEVPDFPPVFLEGAPGALTILEGEDGLLPVVVVDPDGGPVLVDVTSPLPPWAQLARLTPEVVVLRMAPGPYDDGEATIALRAMSADGGQTTAELHVTVEDVNQVPEVFATEPSDGGTTVAEGDLVELLLQVSDLDFFDPEDPDSVTYTVTTVPEIAGASFEVEGPSDQNARWTWEPGPRDEGEYEVHITVLDRAGEGFTYVFTVRVLDFNRPPEVVLLGPDSVELARGQSASFLFVGVDEDPDDAVTVELTDPSLRTLAGMAGAGQIRYTISRAGDSLTVSVTALQTGFGLSLVPLATDQKMFSEPGMVSAGVSAPGFHVSDDRRFMLGLVPNELLPSFVQMRTNRAVDPDTGEELSSSAIARMLVDLTWVPFTPSQLQPEDFEVVGPAAGALSFLHVNRLTTFPRPADFRLVLEFDRALEPNELRNAIRITGPDGRQYETPFELVEVSGERTEPMEVVGGWEGVRLVDDHFQVEVRVPEPHLVRWIWVEGGAVVLPYELVSDDPTAPLTVTLSLTTYDGLPGTIRVYSMDAGFNTILELELHYQPNGPGAWSGLVRAAHTTAGVHFEPGEIFVLPPGRHAADEPTDFTNPYAMYLAQTGTGMPDTVDLFFDHRFGFEYGQAEIPVTIPVSVPIVRFFDAALQGKRSLPIFFEYRALPPADLQPVRVLSDRVIVSVGAAIEPILAPDGVSPVPGLLSRDFFSIEAGDTSSFPQAPGYAFYPGGPINPDVGPINGVPLDGAITDERSLIFDLFLPLFESDEPLLDSYLQRVDEPDEPRRLQAVGWGRRGLSYDLRFDGIELAPGIYRVATVGAGEPSTAQPLGTATFVVVPGCFVSEGRVLAAKTCFDIPAEEECDGVHAGDLVQRFCHQGDCMVDDCDADCTQASAVGGAVLLASGEERFDRVDLTIPGRAGMDFVMRRRYRSQLWFNGPLGMNWDHSWNEGLFIAENGDVDRQNGGSHVDTWVRRPDGSFQPPEGYFGALVQRADGTYVLRNPDGFKRHYAKDGRLVMHEDRHGNTMRFRYDARGNLDAVVDTYGRTIDFVFQTFDNPLREGSTIDRLVRIVDFTGRAVTYEYDDAGDLVSVTTPAVTGTSIGNDFPQGRTERYEYSSGYADARLNHNLLSITSPEEVASGGPPSQVLSYGTDPGDPLTFDKVLAETLGGTNASGIPAGGARTFLYEDLDHDAPEVAGAHQKVTVTDPKGNVSLHYLDHHGDVIALRQLTRGLREGEPAFYETRSTYDDDGRLVRRVHPEGNEERYVYGIGSRASERNLVEKRLVAGPRGDGHGGAAVDLVTTYTYEPLFNQLASVTEPRGNSASYLPPIGAPDRERYTTRFVFDYQESAEPVAEAAEFGVSIAGVTRGLGDQNGDGRTDQAQGNAVRTIAPSVTLLPGSLEAQRLGSTTQQVLTEVQWNDRGQATASIDPEGNVTTLEYYPEDDPDGDGQSVAGVASSSAPRGYLKASIVDAGTSPRRRTTTPPLQLTTVFRYDAVGNLVATRNPRGVTTTFEVNALNEVVVTTHGAAIAEAIFQGELPPTEAPLAYVSRAYRDANGRVTRSEVENRDGTTEGVGAYVERTTVYDILGAPVQATVEVDATTTLTSLLRYDANRNVIETTAPAGTKVRTTFDERDLAHTVTRGADTPEASTVTIDYDRNGNRVRVTDAEDTDGDGEPERSTFAYDGFDRLTRVTDALGGRALTTYDVAGNVTRTQTWGHPAARPTDPVVLLSETRFAHDELRRVFRTDDALFLPEGALTPQRAVALGDHDGDGVVSARVEYDALSRAWARVQDDGEVSRTTYDGASRAVEVVDALGGRELTVHDRNGNAVRTTSVEVSPDGLVPAESFTTIYVYDQLDRLVRSTDAAGQTTRFAYDSRGNLVLRSDPEGPLAADPLGLFPGSINAPGNTCTYVYDGLDRMLREVRDLRVGGTGAGAIDTTNQHNPDGRIALSYVFDANSRLVGIIDDNGNRTSYGYDALNRPTSHTYADGEAFAFTYDKDHNVRTVTDPNGSVVTKVYDALNRLTEVTVSRGPQVLGTTRETFAYDGASRLVRSTDDNGQAGAIHTVEVTHESLGRVVEERQDGRAISAQYSGDGKRAQVTYPGGRTLTRTFDAIDRPVELKDGATVLARSAWIGPGLRELRRTHANGTRLTFLDDAASADAGYDAVQRLVRLRVLTPTGAPIVDREYAYNRASQRTLERRHDDLGLTDRYFYDSAYRITGTSYDQDGLPGAAPRSSRSTSYAMDGVGNRRQVDETTDAGATSQAYAVNAVNQYTSVDGVARAHDDNGNLLDDGVRLFFYDYRNRLVAVTDRATARPIATYEYDADGRRVRKTSFSPTTPGQVAKATAFYYDGAQEVEERDAVSGATEATYVWSPTYVDELVSFSNVLGTFYVHQDARSDVVAVSDAAGRVVERVRYDDFGKAELRDATGQVLSQSAVGCAYGFQGRRLDAETGLLHFRARMYDPETGRFLQRDPVWDAGNVGGQYTFCGNGPVSNGDPWGTDWGLATKIANAWEARSAQVRAKLDEVIADGAGLPTQVSVAVFTTMFGTPTDTYLEQKQLALEHGATEGEAVRLAISGTVADASGVADIYSGAIGADIRDYQRTGDWKELSGAERAKRIVGGGLQLLGTATAPLGVKQALCPARLPNTRILDFSSGGTSGRATAKGAKCVADNINCFAAGTLVDAPAGSVPIEQVRVGQRVSTSEGPDASEEQVIDREHWALFRITLSNPDDPAAEVSIATLRPRGWLDGRLEPRTRFMPFLAEEFPGYEARLESVERCPEIDQGSGRVVLTTFEHRHRGIVRVRFDGIDEPLLVTAGHVFWNETRQAWRPIGEFAVGDSVRTTEGPRSLECVEPLGGEWTVFNLEVQGQHTYFVAGDLDDPAIWVHNACDLYVGPYGKASYSNRVQGVNKTHTPHHAVQDAVNKRVGISRSEGITINLRKDIHEDTRNWSNPTVPTGLSLRQHLELDVKDLRKVLRKHGYADATIDSTLGSLVEQNQALWKSKGLSPDVPVVIK